MNENNEILNTEAAELEAAKERAKSLGLTFHPSISLVKLNERIAEKMADMNEPNETTAKPKAPMKKESVKREALKLVRIRLTCMNPAKKHLQGEFFTSGNSVIGSITKYVHFGVEWHVPQIILNQIKDAKFLQLVEKTNKANGQKYREHVLVPTYAVEVLPALSEEERKELARRQAMAAGTEE